MSDIPRSTLTQEAPVSYRIFVERARQFVESKGLTWSIAFDATGAVANETDWDLRILTGSHARNASRLNGFAVNVEMRNEAIAAGWPRAILPAGRVLSFDAREFLKAVIVHRCRVPILPRSARHEARVYRKFFSVTRKSPWDLNTEDFDRFMELNQSDLKMATFITGLARLMSENMLSVHVPLEPNVRRSSKVRLMQAFDERRDAKKLPEPECLHELTRIVFTEAPRGHQDRMRFCIIRLLILTGLRINEILMLPADCLHWETYFDVVTGKPADAVGGVRKALRLRYFAEKQDEGRPDLLIEDEQWVPERFQGIVAETVSLVLRATGPLRTTLLSRSDDSRHYKTAGGMEITLADMLFLVLHRHRGELPQAIASNAKVDLVSEPSFYAALGGLTKLRGHSTIFTRYGKASSLKGMKLKPHSLRHLMNTEMFRLNVPDTVITQHFGRQSVAQSYEYDHRTLAERLAFVQLPESAMKVIEPGTAQELVAKMVVSGLVANSHIASSFKAIQQEHGDAAAFSYLCANSDGFHVTPYGFCTNSFSFNPCARHLKCFDQCKHFLASGLQEHKVTLEQLRTKLIAMKEAAARKPVSTVGRKNQIAHATRLVAGVTAALNAQPQEHVFPNGNDHSSAGEDLFI